MKRSRRFLSLFLLFVIVFVGFPVWLTYAAVRKERLNYAIVGAVKGGDAATVRSLLERGADANVQMRPD